MQDYGQEVTLHVAAQMRAARDQRGLTLDVVAEAAGLHRTYVGKVMRGQTGITIASASAIARALGLSLGALVSEAEDSLAPRGKG